VESGPPTFDISIREDFGDVGVEAWKAGHVVYLSFTRSQEAYEENSIKVA